MRGAVYPAVENAEGQRQQAVVMLTPPDLDAESVYNPSFDVTPAELITAIVTEKGVALRAEDGRFDLSPVV